MSFPLVIWPSIGSQWKAERGWGHVHCWGRGPCQRLHGGEKTIPWVVMKYGKGWFSQRKKVKSDSPTMWNEHISKVLFSLSVMQLVRCYNNAVENSRNCTHTERTRDCKMNSHKPFHLSAHTARTSYTLRRRRWFGLIGNRAAGALSPPCTPQSSNDKANRGEELKVWHVHIEGSASCAYWELNSAPCAR